MVNDGVTSGGSERAASIVLIGNPNVGKSVIFGYLTGKYVIVANYPGTTVELSKGKVTQREPVIEVQVTRNVLLNDDFDTVIQVADSKNLRRSLLLTIQLAEMGLPFILVQNMADEAKMRGVSINIGSLKKLFGVPVISSTATQRKGLRQLKKQLLQGQKSSFTFKYPEFLEKGIAKIEKFLPDSHVSGRSIALMLLAGDSSMYEWLTDNVPKDTIKEINDIIHNTQDFTDEPLQNVIAQNRFNVVNNIMNEIYSVEGHEKKPVVSEIGRIIMHPFWGIFAVILVLYFAYWFIGLIGAGLLVDFFEKVVFAQYINPIVINVFDLILPFEHSHLTESVSWSLNIPFSSSHEIATGIHLEKVVITPAYEMAQNVELGVLGNILKFLHDFFVGEYGVFTMALMYGFAIVLPIVGTFFMLFSILEDSGYLPRLAVMLNNIFKSIGLNGKAVLPMVLGLGCDTMATMTTRIMETRKERIIVTLLLALGIPCSAQLGVLLAMMSQISLVGTIIWFFVIVAVLITVGYLSSIIMPGESSSFIMEIPPIRKPQFSNILVKTIARMEWYFREVIPLFILGTAILFFLDYFNILALIRDLGSPLVVTLLGLPSETTEAFLIGFLRRDYGAVFLFDAMSEGLLSGNQILVSMITITLFVPCIANVLIIIKEFGLKVAFRMVAFIFPLAFLIGGCVQFILNLLNVTL